jgi:DUF971 family protein
MPVVPKSIKLSAPGGIAIRWSDDHQSLYPHAFLRMKCPCASCRDHPPEVKTEADPLPIFGKGPIKATGAEQIGHYAIQFRWNDGHSSGIYSFDYLRQICPCEDCQKRKLA